MFNRIHLLIKVSLATGALILLGNISGCASDAEIAAAANRDYASNSHNGAGLEEGASSSGVAIDSRWTGIPVEEVLNDASSPLSQRVFYFGYDESSIEPADRDILTQHAEFLLSHPELTVTIEGHADERGSREYNLALGERRAKGVERLFSLLSVNRSQQQVVSFGEERPTALGHDEGSWHFNRRVELLYSGY